MARVKGALNARKKHKKVLKLARGYRGARSKQYRVAKQSVMRALTSSYAGRNEGNGICFRRQKTDKERIQKPVDRKNQRSCKNERNFLQQADSWSEGCRCKHQQKDAGRTGCIRSRCIHKADRNSKGSSVIEKQNLRKGFRL